MIRLGLRLTVAGGREALARLALIVVAVAVGVGLLLATVAGMNAVNHQNQRYAWLETGFPGSNAPPASSADAGSDPLWWELRADEYQGKIIGRVDVAATGPHSPVPPGLSRLPAPGQYYASPAMARLLHRTPPDLLAVRYPGRLAGEIGSAGLPDPDALLIVIGRPVAELAHDGNATLVDRISTTAPSQCQGAECAFGVGINHNGLILILAVVIAALLFPVLIFIGGATRLSAARREQRFAAMRLVGATPRQIAVVATAESAVATVLGVVVGFGIFGLLRPLMARIPFTGGRFYPSDLTLSLTDVLLVAVGVPLGAAIAARLALRRVSVSPLGITRRVTPRAPRAWRVLPLLAGLGELAYFAYVHDIGAGTGTNTTEEAVLFLLGVLGVMIGLVVAGPWLTQLASRLVIGRARRPAALISARRLADNPTAGFRAISGLVLAVFVGTCASAIIAAIAANSTLSGGLGDAAGRTVVAGGISGPGAVVVAEATVTEVRHQLGAIDGVAGVVVVHDQAVPGVVVPPGFPPAVQQVVTCADLTRVPALGRCPAGAAAAVVSTDYGGSVGFTAHRPMSTMVWPASGLAPAAVAGLPLDSVVVATDGTVAANERVRTVLDATFPRSFPAETGTEIQADHSGQLGDYRRLANVVMLTSLPIAGCSLAVSVAGGLLERKRPFSLLRLTGAPLGLLRRVIGLEAAVPLVVTALASVGAGLLAAHLFLRAQLHESLRLPGPSYYAVLAVGLVAALAVIASTLPLLERVTGPEVARND